MGILDRIRRAEPRYCLGNYTGYIRRVMGGDGRRIKPIRRENEVLAFLDASGYAQDPHSHSGKRSRGQTLGR